MPEPGPNILTILADDVGCDVRPDVCGLPSAAGPSDFNPSAILADVLSTVAGGVAN